MLKIGHLSDLHLDYRTGRIVNHKGINVREQDGYDAFHAVVDDVINNDVDVVMVAGDIFHSPKPSVRAIVEAQKGFKKLANAGIKVYSLAGNHDASDIKSDIAASKVIDMPEIGIYSHVEPYTYYEIADGVHLHLVSHHMYSEQSHTMDKDVNPIDGEINIFATHGSVIDQITQMRLSTDLSPREIIVPDFILNEKDWSYRMLGHIHERGFVGSKDGIEDSADVKTFYNGSLIRRGFSDNETPLGRGWTLWNVSESGEFTPEFKTIWQRPQYDFETIDCTDLNASEINDNILSNLLRTRDEELPIVRQTLTNITPAKHSSLDWSSIGSYTDHMLTWNLKIDNKIRSQQVSEQEKEDSLNMSEEEVEQEKERILSERNIVDFYDKWTDVSSVVSELDETVKNQAIKQSRVYIKNSHENLLGDDE